MAGNDLGKRNVEASPPLDREERHLRNLILVGMMGAGKTSLGRLLAKRLNRPFYDSDCEIERRTGVKIPVIFEIEGEAGFRNRESAALEDLTRLDGIVLATGGGAVLREHNRRLLRGRGTVVYLCATVDELWRRTCHDRNRPLLRTADPRATLAALLEERDPLYRAVAHFTVDTGGQGLRSLAHQIEQRAAHLRPSSAAR